MKRFFGCSVALLFLLSLVSCMTGPIGLDNSTAPNGANAATGVYNHSPETGGPDPYGPGGPPPPLKDQQ